MNQSAGKRSATGIGSRVSPIGIIWLRASIVLPLIAQSHLRGQSPGTDTEVSPQIWLPVGGAVPPVRVRGHRQAMATAGPRGPVRAKAKTCWACAPVAVKTLIARPGKQLGVSTTSPHQPHGHIQFDPAVLGKLELVPVAMAPGNSRWVRDRARAHRAAVCAGRSPPDGGCPDPREQSSTARRPDTGRVCRGP